MQQYFKTIFIVIFITSTNSLFSQYPFCVNDQFHDVALDLNVLTKTDWDEKKFYFINYSKKGVSFTYAGKKVDLPSYRSFSQWFSGEASSSKLDCSSLLIDGVKYENYIYVLNGFYKKYTDECVIKNGSPKGRVYKTDSEITNAIEANENMLSEISYLKSTVPYWFWDSGGWPLNASENNSIKNIKELKEELQKRANKTKDSNKLNDSISTKTINAKKKETNKSTYKSSSKGSESSNSFWSNSTSQPNSKSKSDDNNSFWSNKNQNEANEKNSNNSTKAYPSELIKAILVPDYKEIGYAEYKQKYGKYFIGRFLKIELKSMDSITITEKIVTSVGIPKEVKSDYSKQTFYIKGTFFIPDNYYLYVLNETGLEITENKFMNNKYNIFSKYNISTLSHVQPNGGDYNQETWKLAWSALRDIIKYNQQRVKSSYPIELINKLRVDLPRYYTKLSKGVYGYKLTSFVMGNLIHISIRSDVTTYGGSINLNLKQIIGLSENYSITDKYDSKKIEYYYRIDIIDELGKQDFVLLKKESVNVQDPIITNFFNAIREIAEYNRKNFNSSK